MARGAIACKLIRCLLLWFRLQLEKEGKISNELAVVVSSTALACKQIASLVNRAGISNLTGVAGAQNVQVRMGMPSVSAQNPCCFACASLNSLSMSTFAGACNNSTGVPLPPISTRSSYLPPFYRVPFPPAPDAPQRSALALSCPFPQGEDQKKLDVVSNEVFKNCLSTSGRTVSAIQRTDRPADDDRPASRAGAMQTPSSSSTTSKGSMQGKLQVFVQRRWRQQW